MKGIFMKTKGILEKLLNGELLSSDEMEKILYTPKETLLLLFGMIRVQMLEDDKIRSEMHLKNMNRVFSCILKGTFPINGKYIPINSIGQLTEAQILDNAVRNMVLCNEVSVREAFAIKKSKKKDIMLSFAKVYPYELATNNSVEAAYGFRDNITVVKELRDKNKTMK